MTDKQPKALRLADDLATCVKTYPQLSEDEPGGYVEEFDQVLDEAVGLLRTQHAEIERKDALLTHALEMMGCTHEDDDPGHRCGHCDDYVDRNGTLRAAITKELSQ